MLSRAAEMLGGHERLAVFLGVSRDKVNGWLAAREAPPADIVACAMDVLLEP
ncbi:MAG: hypothetical protein ABR570_17865 [Burkholderiales bacterium]